MLKSINRDYLDLKLLLGRVQSKLKVLKVSCAIFKILTLNLSRRKMKHSTLILLIVFITLLILDATKHRRDTVKKNPGQYESIHFTDKALAIEGHILNKRSPAEYLSFKSRVRRSKIVTGLNSEVIVYSDHYLISKAYFDSATPEEITNKLLTN